MKPTDLSRDTIIALDGGRLGLALSGGGLRASLFHVGVLARLAELDLLRQVDVLSCVSGGAIIGVLYYLYLKRELDANGEVDTPRLIELVAEMEHHFLAAVQLNLRSRMHASLAGNLRLARADHAEADRLGDLLDRDLFRPICRGDRDRPVEMRELCIRPRGQPDFNPVTGNPERHCKVPALIVNAAVLNTGHGWRFETDRMGEPARSSSERQVDKNLLLAQHAYRSLAESYARMPLGRAVAASAALPGMVEPLPLIRLYPRPDRPKGFLNVQLVDGGIADPLAIEALLERGCSHFLVSNAAAPAVDQLEPDTRGRAVSERARAIMADRMRALQLARLQKAHPGRAVLLHLMRELEAPEAQPAGPADRGHLAKDRKDTEVTSYGVQRALQIRLARLRTDLDAFSDTEAFALMADGYLMARREFERLAAIGQGWTEGPAHHFGRWRFAALFEALRRPSKGLMRRLEIGRHRSFKGLRLVPRLRLELGLLVLALLIAGGAVARLPSSGAVAVGPAGLAWIELGLLLAVLAGAIDRRLRSAVDGPRPLGWCRRPLAWIDGAAAIARALPLCLGAAVRLRASRLFVQAGKLERIGIEPLAPTVGPRFRAGDGAVPARSDRKAA